MDEPTEVEEVPEAIEKVGYHGAGASPEHETLIGIYTCVYDLADCVYDLAESIDRIRYYLSLLCMTLLWGIVVAYVAMFVFG